jgi:hypothetical protein
VSGVRRALLLFMANVANLVIAPQLIGVAERLVCCGIWRGHRITQMGDADPGAHRLLGGVASGRYAQIDYRGRGCG